MKDKFLSLAKNIRLAIIAIPLVIGFALVGVYGYIDIIAIGLFGIAILLLDVPFIVWHCKKNKLDKTNVAIDETLYKTNDQFDKQKINARISAIDSTMYSDSYINNLPANTKNEINIKNSCLERNLKLANEKKALLLILLNNFQALTKNNEDSNPKKTSSEILNNNIQDNYVQIDSCEIVNIPEGKKISGHNESTIKVRGVQYSNYDADADNFDGNSQVYCKHVPTDKFPESTSIFIDEVFCGHLEQEYAKELVEKYGKNYCIKGKFVEARKEDGYDIIIVEILKPIFTKTKTPKAESIIIAEQSVVEYYNTVTVIDFETASSAFYSACSIGLVLIENDKIIDKQYYLIQPPDNYYHKDNIAIHSITPDMTNNADTFPLVWEKLKQYFTNTYVAAHNANFDMSTLKATLNFYNIEQPNFEYMDSIQASGCTIAYGTKVGKSLKDRCEHFNITLSDHHNALCDAEAAAQLIIYAFKHNRYKTIATFTKMLINLHDYSDVALKTTFGLTKFRKIDIKEIAATVIPSETKDADFDGKTLVFTGELKHLTREQAIAKVIAGGGTVKSGMSQKVDILVNANADNTLSTKLQTALDMQEKGHSIKIISEDKFMEMLENNNAIKLEAKVSPELQAMRDACYDFKRNDSSKAKANVDEYEMD